MVLLIMFKYPKCCWMASWSLELVFVVHYTYRFHQCSFDHQAPFLQDADHSHHRQASRKIKPLAHLNMTADKALSKGVQLSLSILRGHRLRRSDPSLKICTLSDEHFSALYVWWVGQIDVIFYLRVMASFHPTTALSVGFKFKFIDNKEPFLLYSQRHGCWCSGDVSNQGIMVSELVCQKSGNTNHGSRQLSINISGVFK